jgi:Uma2 family endonuclease
MRAWRIYCGRGRANGRSVSETEMRAFVNRSIRPRFDAFTIQRVRGYWRRESEPSFVIEIVHSSDTAHQKVAEIANEYKRRFGQDAVLVIDNHVKAALV